MTARAENPVFHKYVVKLCLINLCSRFSQAAKIEKVYLHQAGLQTNRHRVCLCDALVHWSLVRRRCSGE